jgi:hypothetical protein
MYEEADAPAIADQLTPLSVELRHWKAYPVGDPDQAPVDAVSV